MKKLESNFLNMFIVLMGITVLAAASLGSVYELTKEPIKQAQLSKQELAIKAVIPGFDNDPIKDSYNVEAADGIVRVFPAMKGDETLGAAVETFTTKGFGGLVKVMVGFDKEGNILNYSVLEHKETPGLGSKMQEWFRGGKRAIAGKNPSKDNLTVAKDGGDIDAITAATISSRAFLDAVDRGYQTYMTSATDSVSGVANTDN